MPFTFFAHQVLVIPLKAIRPRWFDGTALCVGSMAPDLSYALDDTRYDMGVGTHALAAQLWWSLPVALVLTLAWRHVVAAPLGAVLPGRLGEQVGALSLARRPLVMTAACAVLGGLSHAFLDGFTHQNGWAPQRFAVLNRALRIGPLWYPLSHWLQFVGHTVGTAIGIAMLVVLIRRRRFSEWSGAEITPMTPHPLAMWIPTGIGVACGVWLATLADQEPATAIIRVAWASFAGLFVGAVSATIARCRRTTFGPS